GLDEVSGGGLEWGGLGGRGLLPGLDGGGGEESFFFGG
ncbi:MAG: hypothetical protein RI897_2696, partial [Verrucomicrobiota bacterium]